MNLLYDACSTTWSSIRGNKLYMAIPTNDPMPVTGEAIPEQTESAGEQPFKDAAKRPDSPPVSRLNRLFRLSALAPRAIPMAAEAVKRAIGGRTSPEDDEASRARMLLSAKKTAEAMLKTLGEMKGLPLKLGQMASYIDGLAPPGYEEKFQAVLSKLQQSAPPLSREAASRVVREELGGPPEELFKTWEPDPFAAASIGQVHRATLKGDEVVAVKVQYPGIDRAVENDLKSISMLESVVAPIGRRYHSKETLDEIKSVFLAELDYRHEALTADTFRRIHEDDPEVVIPKVTHGLTSKRVLTTEWMGGVDYATFCAEASQSDRSEAGKTIWRFMFRALYQYGLLYADPHPGNYRFLGGGRVAFLDFGCSRALSAGMIAGMKRYILAAQIGDWDAFDKACVEVLGFDPSAPEEFRLYTEYSKLVMRPLIDDASFRYTREWARETVTYLVEGGRRLVFKNGDKIPNMPKPINMPSEHTFVNRLQWGLASVLAGLGAEANFRRITDPWLHGPHLPLPS